MRFSCIVAVTGILISGAVPFCQAHATGNVLVPSTNNSSSTPALGLAPQEPAPQPAAPPASPQPAASNNSPTAPTSLPYTPAPIYASPQTQTPGFGAVPAPDMSAATAAAMQTRVMKMPDYSSLVPPPKANLPNGVGIDVDASWSPTSLQQVSDRLGIPPAQVPSTCRMSTKGFVISNKGYTPFDAGTGAHSVAKYDGNLNAIVVMKGALCSTSIPLPPNKGIITQMGDFYTVMLGSGNCQIPTGTAPPNRIAFIADQTGILQCKF